MHLLHVQRQQGEIRIIDVQHRAAGTMFEHVALNEVLPVETGCFAIAAFTHGFVGGQQTIHFYILSCVEDGRTADLCYCPTAARTRRALRATASSII